MAPDLLLHPVFDEAEALAGMPHREVVHPAPEHRIDQVYQPFNRLRPVSAEHLFERPHQRRPLFELGRVMRPHRSAQTAEEAELKAQEPEALTALKVHCAALFIIDFNPQLVEFLPMPFVYRSNQPVMPPVGVDQDDQIVCESRIFDVGVLAIACDLPRSLQHPIHLIEVEVAEQGRDYAALWNALLARSFQHDFQEMHDVRVINPLSHFFQQPVVPDIVEVGSQVKVENARLPSDNCLSDSLDRVMCCPLGPIAKRSRLEIRLEDRLEYELSAPCTTLSRIAGIERTRPQIAHHHHIPPQVTIVRKGHAFDGQNLAAIGSLSRRGVLFVLVSLPDGSRSLIPAKWTDWEGKGFEDSVSSDHSTTANHLARLNDLLHLRKVLDAVQSRLDQRALPVERPDATETCAFQSSQSAAGDLDPGSRIDRLGRHRRDLAPDSVGSSCAPHRPDAGRRAQEGGTR